jgi:hypothetical protein
MNMLSTDPRGPKAVAIATDAGQWLKCRTKDGRKAYGIPSSKGDGHYYLVTRTSCTCYDGGRRTCKHQIAVQLHCDLMAAQEPVTVERSELKRILGRPLRGVIPAAQIERED